MPTDHLTAIRRHEELHARSCFLRLNSGAWIGGRLVARRCYERAFALLENPAFEAVWHSDQAMLRQVHCEQHPAVRVDDSCRLFQTLFAARMEMFSVYL
jgi:hypothetical protein